MHAVFTVGTPHHPQNIISRLIQIGGIIVISVIVV